MEQPYDRFAYPGYAYAATHPARLEAIGRLFGLDPAPAATCRVLEIGCGDGANALSIAQTLPDARVLGIDVAGGAIARGVALARAAGLANVELRQGDVEHLPDDLGRFDVVVAHGVYSWIPPRARGALLACCRRVLTPHGIAFVSYNAYPGSYLRDMTRDVLRYHVRDLTDPRARLDGARELMRTIVAIEEPSAFARVLREQLERMLGAGDALLLHDDLAEVSTPFYFHEFMEHAAGHGLRFLAEAELADSQLRDVPAAVAELMERLPGEVVEREQYLDFFRNRMFRRTLLCHAEAPVRRDLDDAHVARLAISSRLRPASEEPGAEGEETFATPDGLAVTTSEPHVAAALRALAEAWPAALGFGPLLASACAAAGPDASKELVAARLRAVLLEACAARLVQLHGCAPPVVKEPGERPLASPLARAQHAAGATVLSTLLHTNAALDDDAARALLPLLDGTRERAALPAEALERIAAAGLLLR